MTGRSRRGGVLCASTADPGAPGAIDVLDRLVADLRDHIDKEDNGIFPVAVVTLGAAGWETVERARQAAAEPSSA